MKLYCCRLNYSGFTFIEVSVSIMMLSIALLSMAGMQMIAIRGNSFANQLSQGSSTAEDIVESLLLLPYNDPSFQDTTPIGYFTTYDAPSPPPGYTAQWHVDIDAALNKTINVDVKWTTQLGPKTFSLSFLKMQP